MWFLGQWNLIECDGLVWIKNLSFFLWKPKNKHTLSSKMDMFVHVHNSNSHTYMYLHACIRRWNHSDLALTQINKHILTQHQTSFKLINLHTCLGSEIKSAYVVALISLIEEQYDVHTYVYVNGMLCTYYCIMYILCIYVCTCTYVYVCMYI